MNDRNAKIVCSGFVRTSATGSVEQIVIQVHRSHSRKQNIDRDENVLAHFFRMI